MFVIGLLGGIASGKSFVAQELARLGAQLLDADQMAHEVLKLPEVVAAARTRWGDDVLDSEGRISRPALGKVVFGTDDRRRTELKYLEELTHPLIAARVAQQLSLAAANHAVAVVLDVPLLLESGWAEFCDKIIYVDAPEEIRLARARLRGWSDDEFRRREAIQESLDLKRARAEVIIDSSLSPDSTRAQVEQLWQTLTG